MKKETGENIVISLKSLFIRSDSYRGIIDGPVEDFGLRGSENCGFARNHCQGGVRKQESDFRMERFSALIITGKGFKIYEVKVSWDEAC